MIRVEYEITAEDFFKMRRSVGWRDIGINQLKKALDNTMITLGLYDDHKIVAMGRLVGDFSCKGMLTDIIVDPKYQRKGYGKKIVSEILTLCKSRLDQGDKICIEANPTAGNRLFYIHCGFEYDPKKQEGVFLWIENV